MPLILYENQRLDTRLKTLAINGGRPRFSASGLGKQGRRAPFELKLPRVDQETGARELPTWRSDVQLPFKDSPWILPKPGQEPPGVNGAERSHFWLWVIINNIRVLSSHILDRSDWTLDVTHPNVDAEEGWQYARHFGDPSDQWSAEMPPPLERLLTGGVTSPNPGGSNVRTPRSGPARNPQSWVRRRRWVRVMKRRLDMPPLPFLQPDGSMYHIDSEGGLVPYISDHNDDLGGGDANGQEMGSMSSNLLSSSQDYVGRARYLVGTQTSDPTSPMSGVETRRAIAKLERATTELRQGILGQ